MLETLPRRGITAICLQVYSLVTRLETRCPLVNSRWRSEGVGHGKVIMRQGASECEDKSKNRQRWMGLANMREYEGC